MPLDQRRKVAIVGFCADSRDLAPYDDPTYEIWGLNRAYVFMRRYDRWFDLHSPTIRGSALRRPGNHGAFLARFPGPVYLHEQDPAIPGSVAYPLRAVAEDLGAGLFRVKEENGAVVSRAVREPYCDSSIAYELALAIHERFEEILLVGVDLNTDSEYVWQRSGVSYLLGVAQGRGIRVVLPENCPLLTGRLYGRGYLTAEGDRLSMAQLEARLRSLESIRERQSEELASLQGAHRELKFLMDQMTPGLDHEKLDQRLKRMAETIAKLKVELQCTAGAITETLYWIGQTPEGQRPTDALVGWLDEREHGYRTLGPDPQTMSEGDTSVFAELEDAPPMLAGAQV